MACGKIFILNDFPFQKLAGNNENQVTKPTAASPAEKIIDTNSKGTNEKQPEGKESSSTPSAKTKKKSRFDSEGDQNASKRKDERCDMFAENDTFGSNVNVSSVIFLSLHFVSYYLFAYMYSCL